MSGLNTYNPIDDNEDVGTFQQQALEIRLPGANFDPNAPPTTGEEYLTHMAYERKLAPAIVSRRPASAKLSESCENNSVRHVYSASIYNKEESEFGKNWTNLLATDNWKHLKRTRFESMHSKVSDIRATGKPNLDLDIPIGGDSNTWLEFCRQHSPLLSIILNIGQRDLEALLDYICEWLQCNENEVSITDSSSITEKELIPNCNASELKLTNQWLGEWLYATLACLHLPLEPEVHSTLREIARICLRQRGRLNMPAEAKYVMTYNTFILLIATVFGQLDFAEFI